MSYLFSPEFTGLWYAIPRTLWPLHFRELGDHPGGAWTEETATQFGEWAESMRQNGLLTKYLGNHTKSLPQGEVATQPIPPVSAMPGTKAPNTMSTPAMPTPKPAGGFSRFATASPTAAPAAPAPAPAKAAPVAAAAPAAPKPPAARPLVGSQAPKAPAASKAPPLPRQAAPAVPVQEVLAEIETQPDAPALPAPRANHALSAFGALKVGTLAMIAEEQSSTFVEPFPSIVLKGGNAGGTVVPTDSTNKNWPEIAAKLPQGKQPLKGILMGARSEAIAWPSDFDNRQEGDRPNINVAIPLVDGDSTALLLAGAENFQFAPRDKKGEKWSVANGGPGYLRPVFQMLVWVPALGEPVVVSSCGLLATYRKMAGQVGQFVDQEAQELKPVPCVFTPVTEPWYDNNVYHYFAGTWWVQDAEANAGWAAFHEWVADVQANRPDVIEAVMDWCNGGDKPMGDTDQQKLRQAANLVNPRGKRKASG